MFLIKFCQHGSNFRRKFQAVLEHAIRASDKILPAFPLLSKDEKLRAIGHSMNIENLILSVSSVTVSHLIHYDCLKQWSKYYNKMRHLFYYKMRQKFITKCLKFCITKCDCFITKFDSYYKMRRLLQIAAAQFVYLMPMLFTPVLYYTVPFHLIKSCGFVINVVCNFFLVCSFICCDRAIII